MYKYRFAQMQAGYGVLHTSLCSLLRVDFHSDGRRVNGGPQPGGKWKGKSSLSLSRLDAARCMFPGTPRWTIHSCSAANNQKVSHIRPMTITRDKMKRLEKDLKEMRTKHPRPDFCRPSSPKVSDAIGSGRTLSTGGRRRK